MIACLYILMDVITMVFDLPMICEFDFALRANWLSISMLTFP